MLGLVHYNGNREKAFMQRILKKLHQVNSHSNHSMSTNKTTMSSTHESHYCSKRMNDFREQLWCEFAFKTFTIATDWIKKTILMIS